jgi:hypothetical protein
LSVILVLLALALAVVPAALAQDETFGASQEDFDNWTEANLSTFSQSTFSFDGTFSFEVALGEDAQSGDLNLSGVVINDPDNPGFQLDVTGTFVDGGESEDVTLNLRLIDGNIYINDGSGWKFGTQEEASAMLGEDLASESGGMFDPSMFSGGMSDMSSMGDMSSMMEGLEGLNPSDFLSLNVDGDVYTLSLDLGALLSSPAISGLIVGFIAPVGPESEGFTEEQTVQMGQMIAMMFADAEISFAETVDPSTQFISNAALNIDLGPSSGLALNFNVNLSGFNETVNIEVPEGAEPFES